MTSSLDDINSNYVNSQIDLNFNNFIDKITSYAKDSV
jgi:hypothetical protein